MKPELGPLCSLLLLLSCAGTPPAPPYSYERQEFAHTHCNTGLGFWGFLDNDLFFLWNGGWFRSDPATAWKSVIFYTVDLRTGERRYRSVVGDRRMGSLQRWLHAARALDPGDKEILRWIETVRKGKLPSPHAVVVEGPMEMPHEPFRYTLGGHFVRKPAPDRYELEIEDPELSLRLTMSRRGEPLFIMGNRQVSVEKRKDNRYYSFPRLRGQGRLRTGDTQRQVAGDIWYEHWWGQWALPMVESWEGWNVWEFQFDDGESMYAVMFWDLRTGQTTRSEAVTSRGDVYRDIRMVPTRHWTSPRTGAQYPIAWRFEGPNLALDCEAYFPDGEIEIPWPHETSYEGPVRTRPAGRGIQQLVGHALHQGKSWFGRLLKRMD